ncbi:hypothetical protein HOF92_05145 [bacterium]|nr:hypothetical protein [bacterium]
MKTILFFVLTSLGAAAQWDTEKIQLSKINNQEEIQNIHNSVFRFWVMDRNSMEARVVSANFNGENKVYLQHPARKKCELKEGSLTQVNCSLEIEFFHMPTAEVGNETQVFGQEVFVNGRYAGMTRVDRIGYAYMMEWQSIYQLKDGEFEINWGEKTKQQSGFSQLHNEVQLDTLSSFFQRSVQQLNYTHVEVRDVQLISHDGEKVQLEMGVFWRDIQHFGSHNTLETSLVMEFTLNQDSAPEYWAIVKTGELIDQGHFPEEENPLPPRKMGDKWFTPGQE